MAAQERFESSRNGGVSDFIWNIIGGALVSAMLAGVIYVVVGSVGTFFSQTDTYWDLIYLKRYFIGVMIVYMVMPTVLSNVISFIFGGKAKSSGKAKSNGKAKSANKLKPSVKKAKAA